MMMRIPSALLFGAILVAAQLTFVPADAAQREAAQAIDGIARGDISVMVAARGETLYERAADERRTPASVQKILLSMALLDELGPTHRIKTRALSSKSSGVIGNLWLVGGGDPSMVSGWGDSTHAGVARLAKHIEGEGVTRVRGAVVVDSSLFAEDWHAPGWQPWSRDFANRATAVAVDGNTTPNPPLTAGASLTGALERRGIEVGGRPRLGRVPASAQLVARTSSAPLRTLVTHMNVTSFNFYAEMLGKLLGANTFNRPGTMSKGARAIERYASRHGVELTAHDSSGLSYANRVSAGGVVTLLEDARRQHWGRALRNSLPSPGQGTLAGRLGGLRVHAKTGTLWNGSSALAGWVRLRHGGSAEFAVLGHNSTKSTEDAILQRVTEMKAPAERARTPTRPVTRCQLSDWWMKSCPL